MRSSSVNSRRSGALYMTGLQNLFSLFFAASTSCTAAEPSAWVCKNMACSSLRCSVASATALSRTLISAVSDSISLFSVATVADISSMDAARVASLSSVSFFSAALFVNSSSQNFFCVSSSTCSLKSKSVDFSKITEQIDGMIDVLGKEQVDDDTQKKFCDEEFTKSAATKKETEDKLATLAASIEEMTATVETLKSEIETLTAEIKVLDKAVAEATEQRKEEHATFLKTQAEGSAAVQLIEAAKNKLYKFYNPQFYKAPERRELTEEERIAVTAGAPDPRDAEEAAAAGQGIAGTGITVFAQVRSASNAVPPPPPETFGAYQKKDGKSNGVMQLMDNMVEELKTEHTEAKHEEETAQKDYEDLMSASQKSRSKNAESITEKESASSEWTEKIENAKTEHASTTEALAKLAEYIAGLHASCDFLVENYGARKEARTNEIEGLKNAKAVLSGANFA